MAEATVETKTEVQPPAKMTWDEFNAIVKGAERGERDKLPQLREVFSSGNYPKWSRWFTDTFGNPPVWLKNALVNSAGGKKNLAVAEAIDMRLEQVRKELEGPTPTPMECLLAERAAFCWFAVNYYETLFTQATDLTLRQAEFHQRKIDRAHGRFLSALRTLAQVRKLALPALQVNFGANQVNVAGGA